MIESPVHRRSFLTLLGGAAAAWPMAVKAQQAGMPVIGLLATSTPQATAENVAAFWQGLNSVGFVEGRNVVAEYRWAQNQYDRLPALAGELVRRPVAVLAASSTPAVLAAKEATKSIPIVFIAGVDPVATGLVTSLARPGGNLTGVSQLINEVVAKRLELLHEVAPTASLIAVLSNPSNAVPATAELAEARRAAQALGVSLLVLNASNEDDIKAAFATIAQQRAGALLVGVDGVFRAQRHQIVALAARHRLPAIYIFPESPQAGGLMSYGNEVTEPPRLMGIYAGRILKGEKPADLPVQQAVKIRLVINMKTAKALGLTFPLTLLGRADEVIE